MHVGVQQFDSKCTAVCGSLRLDRVTHADVLEYVVWINSYDARLKQLIKDDLMGDK